jgi:hypothetical protein
MKQHRQLKVNNLFLNGLLLPMKFLKFNSDGAAAWSGVKGAAGVMCRDNTRNYVAASALSLLA